MSKIFSKIIEILLAYINPQLIQPKYARVIITANCMFHCQMCDFWHHQYIDPDLDLIKYWIKELADFGIKHIAIGGGEPFLRKDLVDIVKEIKKYKIQCSLTTNGWLIGQVTFPPVDSCEISIDGATPETHDKIRGVKGSWERAINAIKIAQKYCKVNQLNFVLQKDNYHEVVDFCRLGKKFKLPVCLIPCSPQLAAQSFISEDLVKFDIETFKKSIRAALKEGNVINEGFLRFFLDKLERNDTNQRQPCLAPYRIILIFANGDIYPCGNFDRPVGNLSKGKKLKDIYQNYKAIREEVRQGLNDHCNKCTYSDIFNREVIQRKIIYKLFKKFL